MEDIAELGGGRAGPRSYGLQQLAEELAAELGAAERPPVVLFPTLGSSQYEVMAQDKADPPEFFLCKSSFGRTIGWLNYFMMLPGFVKCWADNMRLECDEEGNACRSPMGVVAGPVRSFDAVLALDRFGVFRTYADLVEVLERMGWQREQDLVAHIYDTRLTPDDHEAPGGAYGQLRQRIQGVVAANGGRPAVLVGAALAPRYISHFLNTAVDQAWRDAHVAAVVSVSGVWAGAPSFALTMLSGHWVSRWGGYLPATSIQKLAASTPALSWMLPLEAAFGNRPLVTNAALNTSYGAQDMGKMLRTAELEQAAAVWDRLQKRGEMAAEVARPPPGITLFCFYGTQTETPIGASYHSGSFQDEPELVLGDGDGRVPHESLSQCRHWGGEGVANVTVVEFPEFGHGGIMHEEAGLRWIARSIAGLSGGAPAESSVPQKAV